MDPVWPVEQVIIVFSKFTNSSTLIELLIMMGVALAVQLGTCRNGQGKAVSVAYFTVERILTIVLFCKRWRVLVLKVGVAPLYLKIRVACGYSGIISTYEAFYYFKRVMSLKY